MALSATDSTDSADENSRSRSLVKIFFLILLVTIIVIAAAFAVLPKARHYFEDRGLSLGWVIPPVLSFLLAAFPVLVCFVQATSKKRQLAKLNSIARHPIAQTQYYQAASTTISAIAPAALTNDYILPMMTFWVVTLWCAGMVYLGYDAGGYFSSPNVLLGGIETIGKSGPDVTVYQEGTFVVGCMAFIGAYIYVLSQLIDRVNNNDLYPISFHYYAAWMLIACLVAGVIRHGAHVWGVEQPWALVLVGFAVGFAPSTFVSAILRWAFRSINVTGIKSDPDNALLPKALSLAMIDDLTPEKVSRLSELSIDNAQVLSCQNPFLIWPRLPFELGLIVDWIAQAQLYALVKEKGLQAARTKLVYDIFDLHLRMKDAAARPEICEALDVSEAAGLVIIRQLEEDQCFSRLKEVRDALTVINGPLGAGGDGGDAK